MTPRYVIHIGPHKTGTTYLQHAFTRLHARLAARGICYPGWGGVHGHYLLTEVLARVGTAMQPAFDKLASSGFDTILLSSETFAYWTDAEVRMLAALLRGAPALIVFYCRRWSELLPAHWREVVKHGSVETMSEFVARYLETPSAFGIVDFAQVLARFAGVFGAESLRVASYNAVLEAGEDLWTHFSRSFLGWPDPPDTGLGRVNASLDMIGCEIIRALNVLGWTTRGQDGRIGWYERYMAAMDSRPIRQTFEQSVRFTVNHVHIDDAGFGLGQLHDSIAKRYRYALVPPCPDGRLFEPRIGNAAYIDAGYMMQPGTMATLRDIGLKLLGSDLSVCRGHEMLVEWHAEQETLESGTTFRMLIGPTLNSGMEVSIVWPDKTYESAIIVTANRQEIVIKMEKSGLRWQMTPRTEADAPLNIKLSLPTEDWTVRGLKG